METVGPQAREILVGFRPSTNSTVYRRKSDWRPNEAARRAPPAVLPILSVRFSAAIMELLAGPDTPCAGLMYTTSASAPFPVLSGKFRGCTVFTRLHFRGRGRWGASFLLRALFGPIVHSRSWARHHPNSGRHPGP